MRIRSALMALLLVTAFVSVTSPASAHEADCSGETKASAHVHDPGGHNQNDTVVFCGGVSWLFDEVPQP